MKLTVFYSWQSDLPNSTNRGLIEKCLDKSLKYIYKKNKHISEYVIESDSRDESGTPDIVSDIFTKIEKSDIFLADISIINKEFIGRKTPNPNVLIELGYAASVLGWENILCIFNEDLGKKEELPFDIRSRKPIGYNTANNKVDTKKVLTSMLEENIQRILEKSLNSKRFYNAIKREVDLGLQAVLLDILKILYFANSKSTERLDLNYNRFLELSVDEIAEEFKNKEFMGFQLFRNQEQNVSDFIDFFNDTTKMHFLNSKERNLIAQIIMILRDTKQIISRSELFEKVGTAKSYSIISAHKINPENPENSLVLLEKIDDDKGVVMDSGTFGVYRPEKLMTLYKVRPEYINYVAHSIKSLTIAINDWIKKTGGIFIFNHRLIIDS